MTGKRENKKTGKRESGKAREEKLKRLEVGRWKLEENYKSWKMEAGRKKNIELISESAKGVAEFLLKLKAVQFNTVELFTWASGIKSPIYCDNRKLNSDVEARNYVVQSFIDLIQKKFPGADMIAGVATGGIPFGAIIADRLGLPFIYVRQEAKKHGLMNQVEGSYSGHEKVVVIEDLISTGGSSMKAVDGIRSAGLEVPELISIMTYGFEKASWLFENAKVTQLSLCNLDTIIEVALEKGQINSGQKKLLIDFRDSVGA